MNPSSHPYQLRYRSFFDRGRGFAFPCDARGHVDMDALSDRARVNYLHAREMVGKELECPAVEPQPCIDAGEHHGARGSPTR